MNLLTRLFALHFDRSFSGKGWRQLAWLFGVIVTVFLLIYLVSFAFIFPEPSLEECIIRKSKFPQNPKRSVRFSGKRTKRSVQKRKARNTQKAETKVL